MRRFVAVLFAVIGLVAASLPSGAPRAAIGPVGGPNPNWTDMQKFEWYLGHMARSARMCGAYTEASVLARLARMSPYGSVGLGQMRGDGIFGSACTEITTEAKELVADAQKIENHIETTYSCQNEGCYGQELSDWQFHECGNSLKAHFAILDIDDKDIREVTMLNPAKLGSEAAYLARVQFHSCQGSLYIDLSKQCIMEKKQTRGDCEIEGVERY